MTGGVLLDLTVLAGLLRADGVEVAGAVSATPVGHGRSNLTYTATDAEGRRWIVRRPPAGHVLESAHDVEREVEIVSALAATAVPVPEVVGRYVDDRLADVPVVVVQRVDGVVVDTPDAAGELPLDVRAAVGPAMASTLARIHEVDVDAVGLGGLSSRGPYAERQLRRWSRQWDESRDRDLPELDALTALLGRRVPEQRATSLVHGDFHLQNVIVDPLTGELRAVLDWELSTLGDPLADLGSLLAYWPEPTDPPTSLFSASTLPGFAGRDELVTAYVEASGRDVADLAFWHVLGLWKVAIIAEGVRRRAGGAGPFDARLTEQLIDRARATAAVARLDRRPA